LRERKGRREGRGRGEEGKGEGREGRVWEGKEMVKRRGKKGQGRERSTS